MTESTAPIHSPNLRTTPVIVGVDCGTSSLKVGCFDLNGTRLAAAQRNLKTQFFHGFRVEQDANDWYGALVSAMREICRDESISRRISAIGVAATCSTIVPCDAQWNPVAPAIMWADNRAVTEAEELRNAVGEPVSSESLAPKLLWLARHQPGLLDGKIVESCSWLVHKLCGEKSVSRTIQENLFWMPRETWDLLKTYDDAAAGLAAVDMTPKPATEVAGKMFPATMQELGIHSPEPPIVAVGGNDGLLSALGAGLLCDPRSVCECFGTSGASWSTSQTEPEPADGFSVWAGLFEGDHWLTVSSIETAGSFFRKLTELIRMGNDELHKELNRAARRIDRRELVPSQLPHVRTGFLGGKSSFDDRGASITNITPVTTRTDLIIACLDAIASEANETMQRMYDASEPRPQRVILAGGFSRNPAYRRLRAMQLASSDVNLPIDVVKDRYVGCRGAAMCAAYAAENLFTSFDKVVQVFSSPVRRLRTISAAHTSRDTSSPTGSESRSR